MNENDYLLEQMRDGRNTVASVFLEFSQLKNYYATNVFCFYEGKTDCEYYDSRINVYLESKNYLTFVCGDKNNVIKLKQMINNDKQYNNVVKMFFIDKDFDEPQPKNDDLFETDCYSIENYYVGKEAFENILKTCFHINNYSIEYSNCLKLYEECFKKFHDYIIEYNILFKYKKITCSNDSSRCSNFIKDLNKYIKIELSDVIKTDQYNLEIKRIRECLQPDEKTLSLIKSDFISKSLFDNFNGKIELFCFIKFLTSLKDDYDCNNNSKIFKKNRVKINFEISNKYFLGYFSKFAYTPPELIEFIKAHRIEYNT